MGVDNRERARARDKKTKKTNFVAYWEVTTLMHHPPSDVFLSGDVVNLL